MLLHHLTVIQLTAISIWLTCCLPRGRQLAVETQTGLGFADLTCTKLYCGCLEETRLKCQLDGRKTCLFELPQMDELFNTYLEVKEIGDVWQRFTEKDCLNMHPFMIHMNSNMNFRLVFYFLFFKELFKPLYSEDKNRHQAKVGSDRLDVCEPGPPARRLASAAWNTSPSALKLNF